MENFDRKAIEIVTKYVIDNDLAPNIPELEVFIVWKCKVLQNYKYLISTSLKNGYYFEITYDGDNKNWYFDIYKKIENITIATINDTF